MLKDITIGQYFPGSSPVHRMDPRFVFGIMTLLFIAMRCLWTASVLHLFRIVFCILAFGSVPHSGEADLEKHQTADTGAADHSDFRSFHGGQR